MNVKVGDHIMITKDYSNYGVSSGLIGVVTEINQNCTLFHFENIIDKKQSYWWTEGRNDYKIINPLDENGNLITRKKGDLQGYRVDKKTKKVEFVSLSLDDYREWRKRNKFVLKEKSS